MRKAIGLQAVGLAVMLSVAGLAAAQGFPANQQSKKYHKEQCQAARKIKPDQLKIFASKQEAETAGYKACKRCKP